ncbi:hypothetical protein BOSE62_70964 [Bosea sp. 62]|nr:hypothetical protein BOSE7B_50809 [Bosea sp. 7B]CAD5297691.1 hypothetical protein BOSE21B_90682 [Bosea sp. 21B]CAD5297934.1 hypothetical protein BOSE46_80761 [Bosea sp. 46]VVT61332.1 hypothetical protein BOS5A_230609 [Bosea sp. EC-HK365B]VXB19418.1 hypothetical protein BOSE127_100479 [Bosea sp. 127]VXB24707.1 hypothetical protein BOSE125_130286 [Bosea sp. 125]VXC82357.1 hypothetical protein BOSE29B_80646 [Bosea sp. 29B]VXC84426.1 hypothetical protein BOSE62_70964 [Bosea sp. 62]
MASGSSTTANSTMSKRRTQTKVAAPASAAIACAWAKASPDSRRVTSEKPGGSTGSRLRSSCLIGPAAITRRLTSHPKEGLLLWSHSNSI